MDSEPKTERRSERQLVELAFEAAPIGMLMINRDGVLVMVNSSIEAMFGYQRDELLGQLVEVLVAKRFRAGNPQLCQQFFQNHQATSVGEGPVLIGVRKDGSELPIQIGLNLLEIDEGLFALGAVYDLTQQTKQAEEQARITRELQEAQRVSINLMRDMERERSVAEQARTEAEQANEALQQRAKELTSFRSATINMMRDIDKARQELAQQARELERSNKELDGFAYVASHDLKAPLRAINSLAGFIIDDVGDQIPQESRDDLQTMRQRVGRMNGLLDDLLAYSRVGRKDGAPIDVDTGEIVREIVDMLDPPPDFAVNVQSDMPLLHTPHAAIHLVFRNLIGNAIKHHDRPDGQIKIAANGNGEQIEFVVSDDGPGIPSNLHEKAFGMFQTLKKRDKVEGSGMGLALVKKTVESYGGTINLESDKGRGATFRFSWKTQKQ